MRGEKKICLSFKCVTCDGPTEHIWTSGDGKVIGLRCVDGHFESKNKENSPPVFCHPVFLVPAEEA
jgi:hypothetical protein